MCFCLSRVNAVEMAQPPKKGSGLIEPEDRVLIVGTSNAPYETDKPKDAAAFKEFAQVSIEFHGVMNPQSREGYGSVSHSGGR